MPRGGDLSIMTRVIECGEGGFDCPPDGPPGTYVLLSVSDTGTGMGQETMDRVFEPFFTTKERGRGTGLGLAMVHGIVRQSGGYVLARAVVDSGSTLEVYLPLMVSSDTEASQPRGQVGPE
jgi:signal transduction histidine kinase